MYLIPPATPQPEPRLVVELVDTPRGTRAHVVDLRTGLVLKQFTGRAAQLRAVVWARLHH